MQIWLGVEDFAKIENAKICIGRYLLFVGQNNSGKTFLMQLIQGVMEMLPNLVDEKVLDILIDEKEDAYHSYLISENNIEKLVQYFNERLQSEKESIIKEIFQKEIPIGKLYVDFVMPEDINYKIYILNTAKDFGKHLDKIVDTGSAPDVLDLLLNVIAGDEICVLNQISVKEDTFQTVFFSVPFLRSDGKTGLVRSGLGYIMESRGLFLPASRTGLLLLYREFFLNRTDRAVSYKINDEKFVGNSQGYGGLTKPVYEFLRFLQTYSEDEHIKERYKNELQFFEDHLIEGRISMDKQKTFLYRSKNDIDETPMYLASSMINEVAPIAMAITDQTQYERLIIDEIEASVHPEKQFELVRFLNRLIRKNVKLIISTHSDTFVSKMNNLYVLSHYYQKFCEDIVSAREEQGLEINPDNILEDLDFLNNINMETLVRLNKDTDVLNSIYDKFELQNEDFINPRSLLVYEFVLQPNGKSVVKEIYGDEKTGFQFDLFAGSAMKLYEETLKIGELLE